MNIKTAEFFNRGYEGPKYRIYLVSCLGSLAFSLVLVIANEASEIVSGAGLGTEIKWLALFIGICIISIACKKYTLNRTTAIAQKVVRRQRVELVDQLRHAELRCVEQMERGEIYARVVQDTELLSHALPNLVASLEAALSAIAIFIYMAFISLGGFFLAFGAIVFMNVLFISKYVKIKKTLRAARSKEGEFSDALDGVLSGFKEIKINTRKNNHLFSDIEILARTSERRKTEAEIAHDKNVVFAILLSQIVLGVIVFILPGYSPVYGTVITELVAAVLFLFGLTGMAIGGIFTITRANVAVENIELLKASITAFSSKTGKRAAADFSGFSTLSLASVFFKYTGKRDERNFTVGPVDFSIERGEVLFIVGGNGSGKTSLLKLLTGLYYPTGKGVIMLDDRPVLPARYQDYRSLFSPIFSDFHLFKKLYGIRNIDDKRLNSLLREMALDGKTEYRDGRFTRIDLSTGQRKRLAYITAMLGDKPVYVFDEWAADQDPEFRRRFYNQFLEDLRAAGKTVVAVTHDDRYFDRADRIIKMEDGNIIDEKRCRNS